MAVHELNANARKHGALSGNQGRVCIWWQIGAETEPEFVMFWREKGGRKVVPATHAGFGQTVIRYMTEAALAGRVEIEYDQDGFSWHLRSPIRGVLAVQQSDDRSSHAVT
jgi:two-component sensor histidine kinase